MGNLLGIAIAPAKRAPLSEQTTGTLSPAKGLEGDARGSRMGRQVTVLFREGWQAACAELGRELPWVTRRANLLVEGVAVPGKGQRLFIGAAELEVTGETEPCSVMEAASRGLRAALKPEWRGGVTCNVVQGGAIKVGDNVKAK